MHSLISDVEPPSGCTFLYYPALTFLRMRFRCNDICVASEILPQRAKDLNPKIEGEVREPALILGVFPLSEETYSTYLLSTYLDRMTQEEVDELAGRIGKVHTWWPIHFMSSM